MLAVDRRVPLARRRRRQDESACSTNRVPTDPYRGAGRPEATHLVERIVDKVAQQIGMDPAEIRRKNFIQPDEFPYTSHFGLIYDSGNYEGSLNKTLELVGYNEFRQRQAQARQEGRYLGIGLSTWIEICGFGPSAGNRRSDRRPGADRVSPGARAPDRLGPGVRRLACARPGARDDVRADRSRHAGRPVRVDRDSPRRHGRGASVRRMARTAVAAWRWAAWPCAPRASKSSTRRTRLPRTCSRPRSRTWSSIRADFTSKAIRRAPRRWARSRSRRMARSLPEGVDHGLESIVVLRPAQLRVAVRRARVRGRGRPGDGRRPDPEVRRRRRLRHHHQSDDRRGPVARRHRAGHRSGAVRGGRVRPGQRADDEHARWSTTWCQPPTRSPRPSSIER